MRKKINRYLFYALALFPILDFAIINIIIILFFITIPFELQSFSKNKSKKVFFILFLFILTLIPLFGANFQCSIIYWLEKVIPIYISSILFLFASPYITDRESKTFKNIYIIGAIIYVFKFALIVLVQVYNGKLTIIFEKQFLFYSDIMNLLKSDIDMLDSYYHKPYFSLIILMALFFATNKLIDEKYKTINFSLIVFFLIVIVFPMSLPNVAIVFVYLLYLIYILYKKNKAILSGLLVVCATSLVLLVFYKSFKHKNLDLTEDIVFISDVIQGKDEQHQISKYNPRKIIYTALLSKLNEVPLFGFGYCEGKKTVTKIVEESIYKNNLDFSKNNFLIDTDQLESYLWKKNGVLVERKNNTFSVHSMPNNCQSHTFYQVVSDLKINEFYTFSISVKSEQSNIILRLGEINTQMVVIDINKKTFSHIGKEILKKEIYKENNDYYRISITTKIKNSKNIALVGFSDKDNKYNHCSQDSCFYVKSPQLEIGLNQTAYNKGLSKNEKNLIGSKINAHNIFLQEYFIGGIVGLLTIILLYGWFLYLGLSGGNKTLFIYFLAVIFNSFFENIQYRQIGISIIIIVSILLIFKKKE